MRHEVIVYRNPVEAWYWDNPEYMVYLVVGGIIVVGLFLSINFIVNKVKQNRRNNLYKGFPYK